MLIKDLRESTVPFMGINGLSRLRWLGVTAPEARNPAEAGPPVLTILLASCGSAAPDDAGRGARRRHGGGPTRGDAVTDLPLIKAAKLWARSRRGPGPLAAMQARMIS